MQNFDDGKTDLLNLWSLDRKNQYSFSDKTGQIGGPDSSVPI